MLSRKKRFLTLSGSVLGLFTLTLSPLVSAAGNTINLSSSAGSVQQGNTFTITVRISAEANIVGAQSYITYNTGQLEPVGGPNFAGSPLTNEGPENDNGGGYFKIQRYKLGSPYPTGNFTLATLTFRALGSSGNTTIAIDRAQSTLGDDSSSGANILTGVSGVSIGLQPQQTSSQQPNPGTSNPSSQTSNNNQPTADNNNTDNPEDQNAGTPSDQPTEPTTEPGPLPTPLNTATPTNGRNWLVTGGIAVGSILIIAGAVKLWFFRKKPSTTQNTVPVFTQGLNDQAPKPQNFDNQPPSIQPQLVRPNSPPTNQPPQNRPPLV